MRIFIKLVKTDNRVLVCQFQFSLHMMQFFRRVIATVI